MDSITRKSMLYKTGVEYGDYSMNHVLGCAHGCKYPCYAFNMMKRFGKVDSYEQWCKPKIVSNTIELLDKEIPKLKGKINRVHLCFSTDPFMYGYDEIAKMSIAAIQKLNIAGIKCTALTKGIVPFFVPFGSYPYNRNEYGITLVSLDEKFREKYEPNSAPIAERLKALEDLSRKRHCKTWVSIEPYPTPNIFEQELDEILDAVRFTDKIIFGKWNYNKEISKYGNYKNDGYKGFYETCAAMVENFCRQTNIEYIIKKGTAKEVT